MLLTGALSPIVVSRTAHADDGEAIRARGLLRIGTAGDYAPFSWAQGKGFVGLDIELGKRLAKDFGVPAEFVRFTWPELVQSLKADRFDLAMSGVTLRGDRALAGRLSRPYAVVSAVALIRPADRARFTDPPSLDRDGVRLIVNAGGHLESVARRLFPHATISTTSDNTQLFAPVLTKKADAAISDSAEAHAHGTSGLIALAPMTHDRKALFVSDSAPQFADWVDGWLRDRERDGFLPKLRRRYLAAPRPDELAMAAEAVLGAIQTRCELMPLVGAYKVAHGLPIEDAAQEARVLARTADAARAAGLEPEGVQGLYRTLIAAAKDIEQAHASQPNALTPTLDELRQVIRGIDAQLLAELREVTPSGGSTDWRGSIEGCLSVEGLPSARKSDIAEALYKVHLAS
ncbi:MAG TPA: transporter substrate-binding domain-containing protein [Polyangiaceae bacterium]|nr:transporter substrate-binding domain-containing protein [Polyangiaceae bacterium]